MSMFESEEMAATRESRHFDYQNAQYGIDLDEDIENIIDEFDGHQERSVSDALTMDYQQTVAFNIAQNPRYKQEIQKLVEARHTAVMAVLDLQDVKEGVIKVWEELEVEVDQILSEARRAREAEEPPEVYNPPVKRQRKWLSAMRVGKK